MVLQDVVENVNDVRREKIIQGLWSDISCCPAESHLGCYLDSCDRNWGSSLNLCGEMLKCNEKWIVTRIEIQNMLHFAC